MMGRILRSPHRHLIGSSAVAFGIKIASAGLQFVMFVALAHAMSAEDYGYFGSAFSLTTLLAVVGSLGQRPLSLRFAAAYDETGEVELARGVMRHSYRLVLTGCGACSVVVVLYSLANGQTAPWWILGVCCLTIAMGVVEFQAVAFRAMAGLALTLVPRDLLWRFGIFIGAAGSVVVWGTNSTSALAWVWIFAISLAITAVAQLGFFECRQGRRIFRGPARYARSEWAAPARGLWLSSVIMNAAPALSVILIEHLMGAASAGPFFSALRVAQLLNLLLLATSIICTPLLSRALVVGDRRRAQTVCTLTAWIGGIFGSVGFVGIVVCGPWILGLFGGGFHGGYSALVILGAGYLVNTLAGPTGALLEMSGKQNAYTAILLVFNAVSVGVMPVAVGSLGAKGAAICIALAAAGWNLVAWVYCRRRIGIDPTVLGVFWPPRGNVEDPVSGCLVAEKSK
ncbi:lipopolysaccharide biosynthesis protein [Nocardioides sp. DS6]|uniref:Lipopolysaccharide biosynthesis protein n=1 Tax=Nocardioides eburneus TaxID=3231482 RepID=A0ABV3SV37_9ACTN